MSITRGIVLEQLTEALVVQASPAEVAAFARGSAVAVTPVSAFVVDGLQAQLGDLLYDRHGHVVAVIEDVFQTRNSIDVTTFGDSTQRYVQGLVRYEIRAIGPVYSLAGRYQPVT